MNNATGTSLTGARVHVSPHLRWRVPPGLLPTALVIFLVGGIGPNVVLALYAVVVLVAGGVLLWRPGEPPVLLLIFALGWIGASIAIFNANWLNIDIADYSHITQEMERATILSISGVLAVAVGMRLGAGPCRARQIAAFPDVARAHSTERWFWLYAATAIGVVVSTVIVSLVPNTRQLLVGVIDLKWAAFFLLAYATLLPHSKTPKFFLIAFLIEFGQNLGAYFSSFSTVFLVTQLALVAAGARLRARQVLSIAVLGGALIGCLIVWTAVKGEYRDYVNAGSGEQIVVVGLEDRMSKLAELIGNLNSPTLGEATDRLLRRLSYVEFFGATLSHVPTVVPHANGEIMMDAVMRPFMPRIFFPEKSTIHDSVRTNLYTGGAAGNNVGTSISIGYIGESYIDFGLIGMFPALVALGFFYGFVHARLLELSVPLVGAAISVAVLNEVGLLENSFTKVFGGIAVSLLTAWLVLKFILPHWAPWLMARPHATRARSSSNPVG